MDKVASVFGRGTPAGDAIYRCYAVPSKPSTLDPELATLLSRRRQKRQDAEAAMVHPKSIAKSKTPINCPRVGLAVRRASAGIAHMQLRYIPQRKPLEAIEREKRQQSPLKPPVYAKLPSTECEKDRLRDIMYYGRELPTPKKLSALQRVRLRQIDPIFDLNDRFNLLQEHAREISRDLCELRKTSDCSISTVVKDINCNASLSENLRSDGLNASLGVDTDREHLRNYCSKPNSCTKNHKDTLVVLEQHQRERELCARLDAVIRSMEEIDIELRKKQNL